MLYLASVFVDTDRRSVSTMNLSKPTDPVISKRLSSSSATLLNSPDRGKHTHNLFMSYTINHIRFLFSFWIVYKEAPCWIDVVFVCVYLCDCAVPSKPYRSRHLSRRLAWLKKHNLNPKSPKRRSLRTNQQVDFKNPGIILDALLLGSSLCCPGLQTANKIIIN